jgi:glycosyltransferase involved in cell wall biosynthesis
MPYIEQAVASVLADLPEDSELVIRDNMSTDGTAAWLATINDKRVRVVTADVSTTAGENWSRVCELATGDFVKLLPADDYLTPGALRRQLAVLIANPDVVMVASRRDVISDTGRRVVKGHGLSGLRGNHTGTRASHRAMTSGYNPFGEPASVMFRRDALLASLPFTEEFPYLTDLDMYVKVLTHGSFYGLDSVDAVFRLSSAGWSQKLGNSQYREFRGWLSHRVSTSSESFSQMDLALAETRILLRFMVRRTVNAIAPLTHRKH